MEIVGKVIQILPLQGGTSAATGKAWQVETFIIETLEQYTRKVAIEVFGEQRIKDNPVEIDQIYTISFDLESREFNGRWYTSARAWKIVAGNQLQAAAAPIANTVSGAAPMAAPTIPQATPVAPSFDATAANALGDNTDLPF